MNNFYRKSLLALALLALLPIKALGNEYALIVNSENSVVDRYEQGALKKEIRSIFLKKKKTWQGGLRAKPLILSTNKEALKAFLKSVLKMKEAELHNHWLRIKQMDGDIPPRKIGSPVHLVKMVGASSGALGFVPSKYIDKSNKNIKVLFTF